VERQERCRARVDFTQDVVEGPAGQIAFAARYPGCERRINTVQLVATVPVDDGTLFRQQVLWRYCPRCIAEGQRQRALPAEGDFSSDSE
jgi:hypothetical protein